MTDLEITKLCAEAMGIKFCPECQKNNPSSLQTIHTESQPDQFYDPLHDDAQVMAMVKRFWLTIYGDPSEWYVEDFEDSTHGSGDNLNRAICECVAKLAMSKKLTEIK